METVNDRLNAMTAEEKAELLKEQWWCNCCPCLIGERPRPRCNDTDCKPALMKWLLSDDLKGRTKWR